MTAKAINSHMSLLEWGLLLFLSVLWGGSFFFVEVALDSLSPLAIVALRVSIAAVAIWIFVLARGYPIPGSRAVWLGFLWMGIVNNAIPFLLIVWGQIEVASGLASILNAATPFFTVIVAGVFLRDEPVNAARIIGVLLGMLGVAILVGPSAMSGADGSLLAQLAILGAGLAYAIAAVYARRFTSMQVVPVMIAAGQLTASTLVMIPLVLVVERPFNQPMPPADVWYAIVGLAVISTALAYVIYFRILETAGATNLLLVTLLIPVTAVTLGATILGERLEPIHFVGMAVIGIGLAVIDGRLWRRIRSSD